MVLVTPDEDRLTLEAQVRADIATLGELSKVQKSLAKLAYVLCRQLEDAEPKEAASLARELRQTLEAIVKEAAPSDDDGFIASLSTPGDGSSGTHLPA